MRQTPRPLALTLPDMRSIMACLSRKSEEAPIQMLPYVGFPAISGVLPAATKIVADRGLDKRPTMQTLMACLDNTTLGISRHGQSLMEKSLSSPAALAVLGLDG